MMRPLRAYEYRVVAALFELVEGRRGLQEVVEQVQEELRRVDPELDQFLRDLEAARATGAEAAPVAALAGPGPTAEALAPVVDHPSAPWRPPQGDLEGGEYDYSPTFAAVAAAEPDPALLEAERARAKRDLNRLLKAQNAAEREDSIHRSTVGMRSPLLVELLLDEARAMRGPDPRLALELTEAALAVVRRISPRHYRRSVRFRLLIRAEAHRANALRLLGELRAADSAWRLLADRRERDPVDLPDEEAELLSLEASLRIDLRQFEDADRLLGQAYRLWRSVGDDVGAAKALLKRGSVAEYAGQGERAVELHRRAAELLDPETEPELAWAARHNLADTLAALGRPREAADLLTGDDGLFSRQADQTVRLRRLWVEAHIARADGRPADAEPFLTEVRNGWLSLGRPYEAAIATLESAELHLARGDWRAVKRMAELLAPIFESRGVHREAQGALILFQKAAQAERLTADFLGRLRRYLVLGRNDRTFRFDPAAP